MKKEKYFYLEVAIGTINDVDINRDCWSNTFETEIETDTLQQMEEYLAGLTSELNKMCVFKISYRDRSSHYHIGMYTPCDGVIRIEAYKQYNMLEDELDKERGWTCPVEYNGGRLEYSLFIPA